MKNGKIVIGLLVIALSIFLTACVITPNPQMLELTLGEGSIKETYIVGEVLDVSKIALTAKYNNQTTSPVEYKPEYLGGFSTEKPGKYTCVFTYKAMSVKKDYTVTEIFYEADPGISYEVVNAIPNELGAALSLAATRNVKVTMEGELTDADIAALATMNNFEYLDLSELFFPLNIVPTGLFNSSDTLIYVKLPNSVTTISKGALDGLGALKAVYIGKETREIFGNPMIQCPMLENIKVHEENSSFITIGGVLYNKDATMLVSYPANKAGDTFTPVTSLTRIGTYAFSANKNITTLSLGGKVGILETHAFDGAVGITNVDLTDGMNQIGSFAFYNCPSIINIHMKNTVSAIGENAFSGCVALSSINISTNVRALDKSLFVGCNSLKSISIENTVNTINSKTFAGASALENILVSESNANYSHAEGVLYSKDKKMCIFYPEGKINESLTYRVIDGTTTIKEGAFKNTHLKTIVIPKSISMIEINAFIDNAELLTFSVESENNNFKDVSGVLFNKSGNRLVKYPDNKTENNDTYVIPSDVASIESYAFSGNIKMKTLVIGAGIREIYPFILANMKKLTTIRTHSSFIGFKENSISGSNLLNTIELDGPAVTFARGALNNFNGALDIKPKVSSSGAEFYGYYDSDTVSGRPTLNCRLDANSPKTLTSIMVDAADVKLYTRYGDYEMEMKIEKKSTSSEKFGYYVTSSDAEKSKFVDSIIENYQMSVKRLDGQILIFELTRELIGNLTGTDVAVDEYAITINRGEAFSYVIKVKLKDRDTFNVNYKVNDGAADGCVLKIVTAEGAILGDLTDSNISVKEGFIDVKNVKAAPAEKWIFDKYTFVVGTNKSEYYDDNLVGTDGRDGNISPVINGDTIYFENVLCDINVVANYLPVMDMNIVKKQSVAGYDKIGGELYYDEVLLGAENILKSVKFGGKFSPIKAVPYLTYPGEYGVNDRQVTGFRFKEWTITDGDGKVLIPTVNGDVYTVVSGSTENPLFVRYKVVNVIENNEMVSSSLEILSCEFNLGLCASFVPYYTVTYIAEEGGSIVMTTDGVGGDEKQRIDQKITHGESANKISARLKSRFKFVGWSDDVLAEGQVSTNERQDMNITAPSEYIAIFKSLMPIEYVEIKTFSDFQKVRENPSGNYILKNDIDFQGQDWTPLGTQENPFKGMFEGNGFTLKNFTIKDKEFSGFFGVFSGDVRNLVLDKVSISCTTKTEIFAGLIAAYMQDGSITNCSVVNGKINISNANKASAGSIVGMIYNGVVANCIASVEDYKVGGMGSVFVGGIVGQVDLGEVFNNLAITKPFMKSNVDDSKVGAIVGMSKVGTDISIRYNYYDKTAIDNMSVIADYKKPVGAIGFGNHKQNYGETTTKLTSGVLPNSNWSEYVWFGKEGAYPYTDAANSSVIEIREAQDLIKMFGFPTGKFILVNDIYLKDNWIPISYFAGEFDGNEKIIFNVTIKDSSAVSYLNNGFFAKLGSGAVVSNVGFKDVYIESRAANANVGGIVGTQSGGLIFGSFATGTIAIYNSTNTNAGGISGVAKRSAIIHNTYSVIDITSENGDAGIIGGVVGHIPSEMGSKVDLQFSYSMSSVSVKDNKGAYNLGGFIGKNSSLSSLIRNNFYIKETMDAIDEMYQKPESVMTGEEVGSQEGDIKDNFKLAFIDMPSISADRVSPFDKWDSGIWTFSENGNLNPTLSYETDVFNPEKGDGTTKAPFEIDTYEELKWLKVYNNRNFVLTANIDLTGKEWSPFMFAGVLNGNGFAINGMTFTQAKKGGAALFSELGSTAEILNLNLTNISIRISDATEDLKIGGIAMVSKTSSSKATTAKIENCAVTGRVNVTIQRGAVIGGIVASMVGNGTESFRFNTSYVNVNAQTTAEVVGDTDLGEIKGALVVGGAVGITENVSMRYIDTFGTISISGKLIEAGGVVGRTTGKPGKNIKLPGTKITQANAYANIAIDGRLNSLAIVGGMVGRNYVGRLDITRSMVRNGATISVKNIAKPLSSETSQEIIQVKIGGILGRLDSTNIVDGTSISTFVKFDNNMYDGNIVLPYNKITDGTKDEPNTILHGARIGLIIGMSTNAKENTFESHYAYKMNFADGVYNNILVFGSMETAQIGDDQIRRDKATKPITADLLNITTIPGGMNQKDKMFIDSSTIEMSGGKKLSEVYDYTVLYPTTYYTLLVRPVHRVKNAENQWQDWLYVGSTFQPEKATFVYDAGNKTIEESDKIAMRFANYYVDTTKPGIYVVNYVFSPSDNVNYYAKSIVEVRVG